jgi:hypothetical protein
MDVGSEFKQRIHDQEVRRMRDTYGQDAETPKSPYGSLTTEVPVQPVAGRIADLCKQIADVSHALALARSRHQEATELRLEAEVEFGRVADELTRAIQEHREGTPENVPYPR